jgi:hypothetical protein
MPTFKRCPSCGHLQSEPIVDRDPAVGSTPETQNKPISAVKSDPTVGAHGFYGFFIIGYIIIGIIQWMATIDGLEHWLGISGFFAFILSGFIAYVPIVGTIAGFIGAIDVWGWNFLEAGALFFGPFIASFILISISNR